MAYLLVFSTAPSAYEARRLADVLLRERLVACVNISSSIESHYWWKGKKQRDREVLLLMKTKTRLFSKLAETIRRHHSYSVPEIIATPIQKGTRQYLDWLSKEVRR